MLTNWGTDRIKANFVWSDIQAKDPVIVAVIDTGFDITHPELKDRLWINKNEIANDNLDNDNNKLIDDLHGWDFFDNDSNLEGDDHGTACLGIVLGVNPYSKVLPFKTFDLRTGSTIAIDKAINYCCDIREKGENIRVISCSFIGSIEQQYMQKTIERAGKLGILIVAASGNENKDIDVFKRFPSVYPFSMFVPRNVPVLDNVLSIASVNQKDTKSGFSNFGETQVDVSAPGEGLNTIAKDGKYRNFSGTSAATPVASGAASLLFQYNPNFTPQDVRQILIDSVDYIGNLQTFSEGIINLERAFILAKNWKNNKPPIASNINLATNKNTSITSKLNSTDEDGDNLTYFLAPEYYRGNLLLSKNGDFTYSPPLDYWGKDDFHYTVTDNKGKTATGKVTIEILEKPTIPDPPITNEFIDLSNIKRYATGRDKGSAIVQNGELILSGKAWKCLSYNAVISPQVILTFEFKTTNLRRWHGIGFDINALYQSININQWFNLGDHRHGIKTFTYTGNGEWQSFTIPVGSYFTGNFNYITFIGDDGRRDSDTVTSFRNVQLVDSVTATACRFRRC